MTFTRIRLLVYSFALFVVCSVAHAQLMTTGVGPGAFGGGGGGGPASVVQVLGSVIGTQDTSGGIGTANLLTMSNNFDAPDWVVGPGGTTTQQTNNIAYATLMTGQSDLLGNDCLCDE